MKITVMTPVKALTHVALGVALAAIGIYAVNADEAPGNVVTSTLLMVAGVVLVVRVARHRLPKWAARTAVAAGATLYSTPSDLVRFALATNAGSVNGELAGGMVMSLMTVRDSGIAVAVMSNIAYADTSSLAVRVGDVFAEQTR